MLAIHLAVVGIWFLPQPVWVWLQLHASSPKDLAAAIRAIPMGLVAGWLSFGMVGPIVDRVVGTHEPKSLQGLDLLLRGSPFVLYFVTVFFSWPLVLIPPGARTEDVQADARWFERHPLTGLGLVALVIALGIGVGWASHR